MSPTLVLSTYKRDAGGRLATSRSLSNKMSVSWDSTVRPSELVAVKMNESVCSVVGGTLNEFLNVILIG